jgi:hypothetical protein
MLRRAEAAPGVHRGVFQQQQGVGLAALTDRLGNPHLEVPGPAVLHQPQVNYLALWLWHLGVLA